MLAPFLLPVLLLQSASQLADLEDLEIYHTKDRNVYIRFPAMSTYQPPYTVTIGPNDSILFCSKHWFTNKTMLMTTHGMHYMCPSYSFALNVSEIIYMDVPHVIDLEYRVRLNSVAQTKTTLIKTKLAVGDTLTKITSLIKNHNRKIFITQSDCRPNAVHNLTIKMDKNSSYNLLTTFAKVDPLIIVSGQQRIIAYHLSYNICIKSNSLVLTIAETINEHSDSRMLHNRKYRYEMDTESHHEAQNVDAAAFLNIHVIAIIVKPIRLNIKTLYVRINHHGKLINYMLRKFNKTSGEAVKPEARSFTLNPSKYCGAMIDIITLFHEDGEVIGDTKKTITCQEDVLPYIRNHVSLNASNDGQLSVSWSSEPYLRYFRIVYETEKAEASATCHIGSQSCETELVHVNCSFVGNDGIKCIADRETVKLEFTVLIYVSFDGVHFVLHPTIFEMNVKKVLMLSEDLRNIRMLEDGSQVIEWRYLQNFITINVLKIYQKSDSDHRRLLLMKCSKTACASSSDQVSNVNHTSFTFRRRSDPEFDSILLEFEIQWMNINDSSKTYHTTQHFNLYVQAFHERDISQDVLMIKNFIVVTQYDDRMTNILPHFYTKWQLEDTSSHLLIANRSPSRTHDAKKGLKKSTEKKYKYIFISNPSTQCQKSMRLEQIHAVGTVDIRVSYTLQLSCLKYDPFSVIADSWTKQSHKKLYNSRDFQTSPTAHTSHQLTRVLCNESLKEDFITTSMGYTELPICLYCK